MAPLKGLGYRQYLLYRYSVGSDKFKFRNEDFLRSNLYN